MGSWRLQSSENFENFLRGCGVNRIMAKLALTLTPTEIISCDGDLKSGNWIIKYVYCLLDCDVNIFNYSGDYFMGSFYKVAKACLALVQSVKQTPKCVLDNGIIRLMESVCLGPKVIPLSGAHCNVRKQRRSEQKKYSKTF